jgi:hypothetical protein
VADGARPAPGSRVPDRPPDLDTATLRVWLPRPAEQGLPYFMDGRLEPGDTLATTFGVYTASWHDPSGASAKVIVTGVTDGSILSRVVVVEPSGACPVDKARLYDPKVDPRRIGDEIETIVAFINARPGWAPDDPSVTTYEDFVALDVELAVAKADAVAAGLIAPELVH